MHSLHFAFSCDAEEIHLAEGEVERLLRVLDHLGYELAGPVEAGHDYRAIAWRDGQRDMAVALQFPDSAAPLLVISAADRHDCDQLYQIVADRLPVVPLDGVYDSIALPWIRPGDVEARNRLARGTGLDILAALPEADGTDVDMDERGARVEANATKS